MSQLNNHHGHRMYIVCLYTHQIYDTCMMTWMVPRHRTTSSPLSISSPHSPLSLSAKTKKKREKRKKNSFPPFLERESGSIERENAEAEKLGLDLGVVVCRVWRAVCDLFFAIEESGSLLEFPERFCPFLFSFFLGCFGLGSGEEEI